MNIDIRTITGNDPEIMSEAFRNQGWDKPVDLYRRYVIEQEEGRRVCLIAEVGGVFAGYTNVLWESYHREFRVNGIPEINDFTVLMKYQRMGIGTQLMDRAEEVISERSNYAGIGVGVFSDYGPAQILYIKRGYVPDGKGISKGDTRVRCGESITVDHDVALHLLKRLR